MHTGIHVHQSLLRWFPIKIHGHLGEPEFEFRHVGGANVGKWQGDTAAVAVTKLGSTCHQLDRSRQPSCESVHEAVYFRVVAAAFRFELSRAS